MPKGSISRNRDFFNTAKHGDTVLDETGTLRYSPSTGLFFWTDAAWRWRNLQAGSINQYGYVVIRLGYRGILAHRLAWKMVTGEWPEMLIDHKNLNRADNRWSNLRSASASQNQHNTSLQRNNTSGFKGVHWYAARRKWRARIKVDGKEVSLGSFLTAEEASAAYEKAARRYRGEFAEVGEGVNG